MRYKIFVLVPLLLLAYGLPQENKVDKDQSLHFLFDIDTIFLNVGESADINIKLLNENGEPSNTVFSIYGTPRGALKTHPRISDSTGFARVSITPYKPGTHKLHVRTGYIEDQVVSQINVEVPSPQISNIVFNNNETTYYSKTINSFSYTIFDKAGLIRNNENVKLTSSKSAVADYDFFGNLEARKPGKTIIKAKLGAVVEEVEIKVIKNPVKSITISADENEIRTGDVLHLNAKAWNKSGKIIEDAPIQYSYSGKADFGEYGLPAVGQAGLHASGLVTDDGRFVAETVGLYTISASFGGVFTSKVIKVVARDIQKEIELVGHGFVNDVFTSDLWVWEGIGKHKGKDFAATGTFGANGAAYFWDVTDPKTW